MIYDDRPITDLKYQLYVPLRNGRLHIVVYGLDPRNTLAVLFHFNIGRELPVDENEFRSGGQHTRNLQTDESALRLGQCCECP